MHGGMLPLPGVVRRLALALVAGAVVAAVVALALGQWLAAVILAIGVLAHGWLTLWLRRR